MYEDDDERIEQPLEGYHANPCLIAGGLMGPSLRLVKPDLSHADALVPLANNRNVACQTANVPHPYRTEDAMAWVTAVQTRTRRHAFVITQNEIVIGACGFGPAPGGYAGIQIGYWLGEPYWGNGFAAEACHILIDHIFQFSQADSIWVACRVTNPRSRRVIEKCGFQFRENALEHSRCLGGMQAVERFVLDRRVWKSLKEWGRFDHRTEAQNREGSLSHV